MIAFGRIQIKPSLRAEVCIVSAMDQGGSHPSPFQIELPLFSSDFVTGWTPDNKIGLLLQTPYQEYVYTVSVSGGKATQVSPLDVYANHPRWSPDGKRIFVLTDNGNIRIYSSGLTATHIITSRNFYNMLKSCSF